MTKTILIVDDDPDIRKILHVTLQRLAGWQVLEAEDGLQGVAIATSHRPDAILLDSMMPGISGTETVSQLKQTPDLARIPVIMLTASAVEEFAALNVRGVLRKPFDPAKLPAEITEILQW